MHGFQYGTAVQLWQQLVRESESRQHVLLGEELQAYLVFALMRHLRDHDLVDRAMGQEWLRAHEGPMVAERLRDVGDQCLLIAGLYPELAQRRLVDEDFYVGLGRSAYSRAARRARTAERPLFALLVDGFHSLRIVLRSMRQADALAGMRA